MPPGSASAVNHSERRLHTQVTLSMGRTKPTVNGEGGEEWANWTVRRAEYGGDEGRGLEKLNLHLSWEKGNSESEEKNEAGI